MYLASYIPLKIVCELFPSVIASVARQSILLAGEWIAARSEQ
jgi:hypothetical protein